jgi:predicted nucleic acid-binding protein
VIYLDSAAIIKLIRPELETAALIEWLAGHGSDSFVTSTLAEIEVPRALRHADPGRLTAVPTVLARLNRIDMDAAVRATAAEYPDPMLRSLDAIHLASAQSLVLEGVHLTAFVTYDKRLLAAAEGIGLAVVAPA